MTRVETAQNAIRKGGIIAIVRGDYSVNEILHCAKILLNSTIHILEVTLNSATVLEAIPALRRRFDGELLIGAGTVRTVDLARGAHNAGAEFLVAPNFDLETVQFAQSNDLLHIPGVFTGTEAQTAYAAGCTMLKLFPADIVGPAYLKALRAPLNDIEFIPTGGVSLQNITDYARAGAVAVGLGSQLISKRNEPAGELSERALALRKAWQAGQHG